MWKGLAFCIRRALRFTKNLIGADNTNLVAWSSEAAESLIVVGDNLFGFEHGAVIRGVAIASQSDVIAE